MRDPGARARAHHRLERGDEAARRALDADAVRRAHVDVGLAVGDDDDVVAVQFAAQRRAQRLLVPDALAAVERPVLALEVADQLAQVARDRPQLRRRAAGATAAGCLRRAAARAGPRTQPRHESCAMTTVISAIDSAERDEEIEEVAARLLAAPLDEAHVVDQHQLRARRGVAVERACRDVQHAVRGFDRRPVPSRPARARRSGSRAGTRGSRSGCRRQAAKPDRVQALVARELARNATIRASVALMASSLNGSCTVVAIRFDRMSRSRTNQRSISASTAGPQRTRTPPARAAAG